MNVDWSAIGEIVGAAAVVVSLIYVGYQLKETRKAGRAATAQARTDLGIQLISARWTTDIADLLMMSVDGDGMDNNPKDATARIRQLYQR